MIICAALKVDSLLTPAFPTYIAGLRHSDCYETFFDLNGEYLLEARKNNQITEGFINNHNEFLDRKQAYSEALDCGQLSAVTREAKRQRREDELYSEDLY